MKRKDFGIQYSNGTIENIFSLNIEVKKDTQGKIISGLTLGPTLEQNMASLLVAVPGDLKLNLDIGVGISAELLGEDLLECRHNIKEQFAKDGLVVKHLDFYNLDNFSIDAEYE